MPSASLYLRSNVVVEPLVDQWYAWSHLIPPATAARNLLERHFKIMESYIENPQVHAAACKEPAMRGGPFIDCGGRRVDEISDLLSTTRQREAHLVDLGEALRELDELLRDEAHGFSLEPLYERVPAALRGFVELVYDLNNQPSFRLIEPLLYRSRYYQTHGQSLMLSLIHDDERPFVLSTPRLPGPGELHVRTPFAHPGIDALFRAQRAPTALDDLTDALEVETCHAETFRDFFTPDAPHPYDVYEGNGMRWRYFGHACILLETRDLAILLDPVLSYTYENGVSRYTYDDLPDHIDCVLITHNHQDHILFETMIQLRHKVGTIVVPRNNGGSLQDPSLKLLLEQLGFDNVVEMAEMEVMPLEEGSITAIPFLGEHSDLNILSKLAYCVRLGRHSLLFAADSCNVDPALYDHVREALGQVDVLFLGMECDGAPLTWVYGPLLTRPLQHSMDQSRRLAGSNYERGMEIVRRFDFKEVYVYAMGQEPWLNYISRIKYTKQSNPIVASDRLVEDCRDRGIVAERLFGEKEILLP